MKAFSRGIRHLNMLLLVLYAFLLPLPLGNKFCRTMVIIASESTPPPPKPLTSTTLFFWSAVNIKNQRATQRAQIAHKATWGEPITPDTQLDIHPRKISSKLEGYITLEKGSADVSEILRFIHRLPGAPNGSVPHNICSTEKILLAGNWSFGCSPAVKNLWNVSKILAGGILSF